MNLQPFHAEDNQNNRQRKGKIALKKHTRTQGNSRILIKHLRA